MGQDTTVVDKVAAPPLKPLSIPNRLAATPGSEPKFTAKVKAASGSDVVLGDPKATRALVALMNVHAVNGGAACHWGGPAALAEINASIHGIMFSADGAWHESYNYVNDAGHTENGVYALRANYGFDGMTLDSLKGFRGIESKLTGHGESHLNPEGVLLSNGPLGSALPQAQGLSFADKLTGNDRATFVVVSDGAAMEGEAKEAFSAIPGLAAAGKMNPFVMVVSDNDTKLSGRITKDAFSMIPSFDSLDDLGWNVIVLEKGNDLQDAYAAIEKGLAEAKANPNKPVCVWAKTIKGFGVKSTEESSSGGHGFPLKGGEKIVEFVDEIYSGSVPDELGAWAKELRGAWEKAEEAKKAASPAPKAKAEKVQAGLARGAVKAVEEGLPVFSLSADLAGSTGMSGFQKSFDDRSQDLGVAESNMINMAAGVSKLGYIPIVDTFAQFGVTKGNLPLTMAALSQAPVIAVFSHAGFQDAADGASHQGLTYLAAISPIPHTAVVACSCADEAEAFMHLAIKRIADDRSAGKEGESVVFFVGRESYPSSLVEGASYEWGKAQVMQEGTDVAIVASGALVGQAYKAGQALAEQGIKACVINNAFVNQPDVETIGKAVDACGGKLVTLEDHQLISGMGSQLCHALTLAGHSLKLKSHAVRGEFGQSAYKALDLYERHGLAAGSIIESAKSLVG